MFRPTPPGVRRIVPGVVVPGCNGIFGLVVISIAADPNTWTRTGLAAGASAGAVVVVGAGVGVGDGDDPFPFPSLTLSCLNAA